jgi:hypothetical protein
VTDFDVDPRNPDIMYAAAYQRRRRHASIIVAGGPDSGIFKTTDAGAHWTRLTEGIPTVDKRRIALAVSPQKFGLSFTVDGGRHWVKIKGGMPVIPIRDLDSGARKRPGGGILRARLLRARRLRRATLADAGVALAGKARCSPLGGRRGHSTKSATTARRAITSPRPIRPRC